MNQSFENRIDLVVGDITQQNVHAVVTAANSQLIGGGGVDGAVHRAAGPELVQASKALAPCPPGDAKITTAFELPMDYVIHAVGPIFKDLDSDSPTLASAYRSSLQIAREHRIASVAFPCISTGVYHFPKQEACEIAIMTVVHWLKENDLPERVVFCCFESSDAELYRKRLEEIGVRLS